ncbi:MAG: hypothetical protein KGJ62_03750 [Armatimonadetes bacterium]|nr:hypothetical protein [Armatimonadota bacterium]MDE2205967.1 hypothetical protein [Armatimonadota bacterium]
MSLHVHLGFVTSQSRDYFSEKWLYRLPGCNVLVDGGDPPAAGDEGDAERSMTLDVSSPTAARALCHALLSAVQHAKATVSIDWVAAGGEPQQVRITSQNTSDGDIAATRLSAALHAAKPATSNPESPK